MTGREIQPISFWKSLSKLDWLALGIAVAGSFATWVSPPLHDGPGMGFLRYLGVIALFYVVYRFWSRWRGQLLWSLRNRLIVAYMFIAFVPIILLLILAVLAAQIIYSQLGAYLLYEDIQHRIEMLAESTATVAAAEKTLPDTVQDDRTRRGTQDRIAYCRTQTTCRASVRASMSIRSYFAGLRVRQRNRLPGWCSPATPCGWSACRRRKPRAENG